MKIKIIKYDKEFLEMFSKLPKDIKNKSLKAEVLLKENAFHPSLRLHKLHGKLADYWSVSVDRTYRIIFGAKEDGVILFISVGKHSIYN